MCGYYKSYIKEEQKKKIIDDYSGGEVTPLATCICNTELDNHKETRGIFDPWWNCKASCKGTDNKNANYEIYF